MSTKKIGVGVVTNNVSTNRVAAVLAGVSGLGFGLPAVYGTWHFARTDEIWYFMGLPTYGDGPFEGLGIHTSVPLLAGFAAVCAAELVAGTLLWRGRRGGPWLSLALLPIESLYWFGFALPFGPVFGLARTALVLRGRSGGSWSAEGGSR